VTACPPDIFWAKPKSGTGAIGMISTMP
jgi:hypothetical protein